MEVISGEKIVKNYGKFEVLKGMYRMENLSGL